MPETGMVPNFEESCPWAIKLDSLAWSFNILALLSISLCSDVKCGSHPQGHILYVGLCGSATQYSICLSSIKDNNKYKIHKQQCIVNFLLNIIFKWTPASYLILLILKSNPKKCKNQNDRDSATREKVSNHLTTNIGIGVYQWSTVQKSTQYPTTPPP